MRCILILCNKKDLLPALGGQGSRPARDICNIRVWLGSIYEWADKYRQVNISKAGFLFAAAGQVPKLMASFEKEILRKDIKGKS